MLRNSPAEYYSPDYATARDRFLAAAGALRAAVRSHRFEALGPRGEPLTMDVARIGDPQPERLVIELEVPEPKPLELEAEDIPLDIVYEDDEIIVIDKPPGLVVHPASGHETRTLVNALLHHCSGQLSGIGGVARPGIVHRLDKETSGIILFGKTTAANRSLTEQFTHRQVQKRYFLLTDRRAPTKELRARSRIVRLGEKYVSRPAAPASSEIASSTCAAFKYTSHEIPAGCRMLQPSNPTRAARSSTGRMTSE